MHAKNLADSFSAGSDQYAAQFLIDWSLKRREKQRTEATAKHYIRFAKKASAYAPKVRLRDFTRTHAREWCDRIIANHNQYQARRCYEALRRAFNDALESDHISINHFSGLRIPKPTRKPIAFWDESTLKRYIRAAVGNHLGPPMILAATTGMRIGEVCGAYRCDFDLRAGTITVCRAFDDSAGKMGSPKTDNSVRTIPLADELTRLIKNEFAKQDRLGNGLEFAFVGAEGRMIRPTTLRAAHKRLINEQSLPPIRFHDLRHTATALMIREKLNLQVISKILGHKSVAFTIDTYGHLFTDSMDDTKRMWDRFCSVSKIAKKGQSDHHSTSNSLRKQPSRRA